LISLNYEIYSILLIGSFAPKKYFFYISIAYKFVAINNLPGSRWFVKKPDTDKSVSQSSELSAQYCKTIKYNNILMSTVIVNL